MELDAERSLETLRPMVRRIEGSVMAALQGVQQFATIANITTLGLVHPTGKPLVQTATDNRCSAAQPALKCLISGKKG